MTLKNFTSPLPDSEEEWLAKFIRNTIHYNFLEARAKTIRAYTDFKDRTYLKPYRPEQMPDFTDKIKRDFIKDYREKILSAGFNPNGGFLQKVLVSYAAEWYLNQCNKEQQKTPKRIRSRNF